jgi:HSP20 family molecular chaperone IbpA
MTMARRDPGLLADAIELLREADRLQRQFFTVALGQTETCWAPPVDIVEGARTIVIRVALPGVASDSVEVSTDGESLHVVAVRALDAAPGARIHRLEIPYGRFERRIDLPAGRYEIDGRELVDGCLVMRLNRIG